MCCVLEVPALPVPREAALMNGVGFVLCSCHEFRFAINLSDMIQLYIIYQ